MGKGVKVKVWGDYALFSRPEMKVERCSYDVITPSAARGILEAIYPRRRSPSGSALGKAVKTGGI